jgi:CheY-like chemotaxis protein
MQELSTPSRLLLVEPDVQKQQRIINEVAADRLDILAVATPEEAIQHCRVENNGGFNVVVMGLDLGERRCFELIDEIIELPKYVETPILIWSDRELTKKEENHIKRLTHSHVIRDVRSFERLVDDVLLFLHRPLSTLAAERRAVIDQLHDPSNALAGKRVLVVDDDIRNIFAMTSVLESLNMQVASAETGRAAIDILQQDHAFDVVLKDIMMPDMDGYDTMRAIRKLSKFRSLPIIALTAKAMKGDREKCIQAGASDYISKPVDIEQLLGLLRMWLHR